MRFLLGVQCFLIFLTVTKSAKILAFFPVSATSHFILGNALLKGLTEKGHDVTMISPFENKEPPKNGSYRDIVLTGFLQDHEEQVSNYKFFENEDTNPFLMVAFFTNMLLEVTEKSLNHPNVQKLLKSEEKFDAVIVEEVLNFAHKGLAAHFDAPLILFSTVGSNAWINNLVGNPEPYSYVPDLFLSYSNNMDLWQRLFNTMFRVTNHLVHTFYVIPKHKTMYQKIFLKNAPFEDVVYNSSIVLLNSHPSIHSPTPIVPNMIDIGGYHIKPTKKLPADLQKFLDGAKNGVIYFSMGSNLRSAFMPPEKRDAFLKSFQKLKQQVLWKWEEDELPGKPENVKLSKWLPQQDVLAHPNVKLFITHGGLLSTTETVHHGVPVLAIPIMGDQNLNAQKIENSGIGLQLSFQQLTEATLTEKLQELLLNSKYTENAKKRSKLYHDRINKPMDTAVYWIEYVIRHKGAPHLRVAGVNMPFYKYMLLDVLACILGSALISCYIVCKSTKFLIAACCGSNKKEKTN